jgi:hypothetical protein
VESASIVASRKPDGVSVPETAALLAGKPPVSDQAVTGNATIARTARPRLARLRAQSELRVS